MSVCVHCAAGANAPQPSSIDPEDQVKSAKVSRVTSRKECRLKRGQVECPTLTCASWVLGAVPNSHVSPPKVPGTVAYIHGRTRAVLCPPLTVTLSSLSAAMEMVMPNSLSPAWHLL